MSDLIKKIIQGILRNLAGLYIRVKKIDIIAITGSAGKTTTKMTIGQIVPGDQVYVPEGAYNTEYGVPLALFREKVPVNPRNLFSWCAIILKMAIKLVLPAPYHAIVLEFGADKPGDISYLTGFAKPHIAVVTTVLPVHLEGFGSLEEVAKEKSQLIKALTKNDFAILNFDDDYVCEMAEHTEARVKSFGKIKADLVYDNVRLTESGMSFDIIWKKQRQRVHLPIVGPQLIPSYLSAILVGLILGNDLETLVKHLADIKPERGRMNLLSGVHGSVIIDDSYNSNPESAKAALEVLRRFKGYKIAVLGSMNELGDFTEEGHKEVGKLASIVADQVVTIGETASKYLYPTVVKKMNKKFVQKFENSHQAGEYLAGIVKDGDVILFKGSQNGVFTEEAIKYVLDRPELASELLVRQGKMWQDKKGKLR
jgi:UDP-N-acetylmuramoyl-tripeptide--D-alanyl-D-alanine ligase